MNTHNMRKMMILLPCVGIIAMTAASCSKDQQDDNAKGPELVFSVSPLTRAAINYPIEEYFAQLDEVIVIADLEESIYKYNDGLLQYESGIELSFPSADAPLKSVQLFWLAQTGYEYDQSTKTAFLTSDFLMCSFTNLMPTNYVPVVFSHPNYKMTFTAGGANEGRTIIGLWIIDGNGNTYNAYCDPNFDDAQLMLLPGTDLSGTSGFVTFEGDVDSQEFVISDYDAPDIGEHNQNITVTIML